MSEYEKRVRELAYQIWQSEGQPEGQRERHWQMAVELMAAEEDGELRPTPVPTATSKPRARKPKAPAPDEAQLEKPALLGKPAAAKKASSKPAAGKAAPGKASVEPAAKPSKVKAATTGRDKP